MPPLCPTPTSGKPLSVLHPYLFAFPPCGCLVAQLCLTSCDFMDCSVPGFPVLHHLLELAQIHVHRVSDAIYPSHPLSPPSPAFNLSQHQTVFRRANSSDQVAKVLELQLQHQSFKWNLRTDFLEDGLVGSPCSPRDSLESPTPQFKSINSLWSNSHIHTWLLEKP